MAVSMADITKLRKLSGAGMMDCKKALEEAEGDFDKAMEIIRKKGQAVAAKRSDRVHTVGIAIMLDGALSDSCNEVIEESSHIFFTSILGSLFPLLAFFFLFALLFSDFGKDNRLNRTIYVCIFKFTLTQQFFQCLVDGAHLTIDSLPIFGAVKLLQTCSILIRPLPHIAVNHNSRIDILVDFRNALPYSDEQCSLFTCAFSQKVVAQNFFLYKSSTKIWKDFEICHHIVTTFSKLA